MLRWMEEEEDDDEDKDESNIKVGCPEKPIAGVDRATEIVRLSLHGAFLSTIPSCPLRKSQRPFN